MNSSEAAPWDKDGILFASLYEQICSFSLVPIRDQGLKIALMVNFYYGFKTAQTYEVALRGHGMVRLA